VHVRRFALALPSLLGLCLACDPKGGQGEAAPAEAECKTEKADCDCEEQPKISLGGRKLMPDKGDIQLAFEAAKKKELAPYRDKLESSKKFDEIVAGLNDTIAFPRSWAILMRECGRVDAYYEAGKEVQGVVICYELVEHFRGLFAGKLAGEELEKTVIGAVFFAFLHEVGHALVHQLDLPVTGKEEDAVDQLAAVILLGAGRGTGLHMAIDGARAFLLHSKQGFSGSNFWDEHSFEEQRYYSIMCLAYGADPKKRTGLVGGKDGLPIERAKTCPAEYERVKKAWTTILGPHGKA
jgi:hypothetical protein